MSNVTTSENVETDLPTRQLHCNKCLRKTNHAGLYSKQVRCDEELGSGYVVSWGDFYTLAQCRGCDTIRMLHESWFSEVDDGEGNPIIEQVFYPPNVVRQKPQWLRDWYPLEEWAVTELIDEIYNAVGVEANRLAAMGIRAVVEQIMIEKVGDLGSFEKNISLFFERGYVAVHQQKDFKGTLIEAGHAAMHRGWKPSAKDLDTLLDIVESLIKAIYFDPERAEDVSKRIPARKLTNTKRGSSS